jgi:transposase
MRLARHLAGENTRNTMPDKLEPKDRTEAIAIFRSELIGALTRQELCRGDLRAALAQLSEMRLRPPDAERTRSFSVPTLERWYYRYKKHGIAGLSPRARSDKGRAKRLSAEQQTLICDIRREHPNASASLILRTLTADGRLEKGAISASSLRRFQAWSPRR